MLNLVVVGQTAVRACCIDRSGRSALKWAPRVPPSQGHSR